MRPDEVRAQADPQACCARGLERSGHALTHSGCTLSYCRVQVHAFGVRQLLDHGEGGDKCHVMFPHQLGRLRIDVGAVFHAPDAGPHRVANARIVVRVDRDVGAARRCFFHCHGDFLDGELCVGEAVMASDDTAGDAQFQKCCASAERFAHVAS